MNESNSTGVGAQETYTSAWVEITQQQVDQFAELTDDHQFIHVDPVAAARTPLGGTIVHGFFVLSLLTKFSQSALPAWEHPQFDVTLSVNYGFDKIRFIAPVRVGKRVRAVFSGLRWTFKDDGRVVLSYAVTVEVEGEAKPAIVADWLFLLYLAAK